MEDKTPKNTTDNQALKTWCSPSITRWEVDESLELNPIKLLVEFNQTLGS